MMPPLTRAEQAALVQSHESFAYPLVAEYTPLLKPARTWAIP